MSIGSFHGCLVDDIEHLVSMDEGEIRIVKQNGMASIMEHTPSGVFFGSGRTLETAYAALIRDRNKVTGRRRKVLETA